jgi:transposase
MQFTTWIEAEVPRVECTTHGVKQLRVPWAEPGSQFTALFERLAIDLLRECSITGAIRLLRISWDEGWGIKGRAVKRGLARRGQEVVARLGVDEKAIAKRHRYLTIVADLDRPRVLYLADDRKQASLDGFWPTLTPAQRAGITAVAMDMWEPYVQSTRAHLPEADAKIVFDKFHVVKHLHDAVDHVRRGEHRTLKRDGDARLTGSKYLWLRRPADLPPEQRLVLRPCSGKTSRWDGPGRSRSASAPSGSIGIPERLGPSSPAGTGARPTAGSNRWRPSPS